MIDQCVEADIAPASKYKVVYSGMELEPFLESEPDEALKKELGIPDNAKVIGAIARLFPLKGYEYFIPAAKEVTQNHPEAHFLIVGDGIMTEDIKKQIKELGIDDKFSFAGLVSPNEIPRYAALMDILAHFSLREGLPRAVVQALASGKPAVAFNLDGSPEVIIDGETGYIVEPEDVKGAANALSKLLSDPELSEKLGKKGRDFVSKNWDWRLMCDVLEKEYLENT
jgi:glycosyltransferase involved in cell wall biosynthesis